MYPVLGFFLILLSPLALLAHGAACLLDMAMPLRFRLKRNQAAHARQA